MIFCGIDIGTTSTKAVVLDRDGEVLDETVLGAPTTGEAYWYEHFCQALDFFASRGRFRGEDIACSVTGQGGSFVFTDESFHPVGGACSWTELADEAIVRDMVDIFGESGFYRLTGWPPHGWLAACKLRQSFERKQVPPSVRHIMTAPDFVCAQLTGEPCTDITSAQITGLADFQKGRWSRDILAWAGIPEALLPPIESSLGVLKEGLHTRWGKLTLVTGSHDQYAAMEAAGLAKDTRVMLGTGAAWVINGRTSRPLFDDRRFRIHPGTDLHPGCYGFIITLWQIGAGFDRLLTRLGVTHASLAEFEDSLTDASVPQTCVKVDLDASTVEPAGDSTLSVKRYMEWSGSVVAHALGSCGLSQGLEKIVVAGGAMSSRLWPQIIADVCGLTVEAVECPQFTAYGAASHAREALLGRPEPHRFPSTAMVRTYTPRHSREYRTWYQNCQKPLLDVQDS
jgi:sugar (pentulose or hexulose) kinase